MLFCILNFNRTGVRAGGGLIEALSLKDMLAGEIVEYEITDFFSNAMNNVLDNLSNIEDKWQVIGINYPIENEIDVVNVMQFIRDSLQKETNLCYYPKPNYYLEIDDFALFSIKKDITFDNYKIEKLYRQGQIDKKLRNKLHKMVRYGLNIPTDIIEKKIFFESRKLFNLAFSWELYHAPQNMLRDDLLYKTKVFYNSPYQLAIQLTNQCNLACVMCMYHSNILKKPKFFKEKTMLQDKYIYEGIDYAANHQCELDFTSPGEVLLDDRIYGFIKYAKEKGLQRIGFTSNATLLDKNVTDRLLECGLTYVRFSVDGATEETYRKIRGGDINKVRNNIIYFMKEVRKLNREVEINLNCVLVDKVKQEIELYKKFWNPYLDVINYISFSYEALYEDNGYSKMPMPQDRYVCHWPWFNVMAIRPDGKVASCCSMMATMGREDVCVGNIKEESLNEIWHGERMKVLRRENLDFSFKQFDICKTCTEWSNNRVLQNNNRSNGFVLENR